MIDPQERLLMSDAPSLVTHTVGPHSLTHGDCRDAMAGMPAESVDAIVCDPPYGLNFMGKEWDHGVPGVAFWSEAIRVLKPGGHLLAFGGTRTFHRLACAIEDAGFEIRDCLSWMYGSGFPKSMDVSKAIDKAKGAERTKVVGTKAGHEGFEGRDNMKSLREGTMAPGFARPWMSDPEAVNRAHLDFAPATPEAAQWQGWGTALKPAWEPIVVARKPLVGTVAANVLEHGTGAINIDGTRIDLQGESWGGNVENAHDKYSADVFGKFAKQYAKPSNPAGRWPANVMLTHHEDCVEGNCHPDCPVRLLEHSAGAAHSKDGASRFFYCTKVSKKERNLGVPEGMKNDHPTCKPVAVMAWLCRLVTPPGGIVLDPFMGSGSIGVAAIREGFTFIGIDKEREYCNISWHRVRAAMAEVERLTALPGPLHTGEAE